MNAALPTGRSGQIIAVLLLLLVLIAGWRLLVEPVMDFYAAQRDQLDQRVLMLGRLERLASQLPVLQSDSGSGGRPRVITLGGSSDAVAAANLQNIVQDLASNGGVSIGSVEILPVDNAGSLRRIGLRLSVNGAMAPIMHLLQSTLDAEPPLLIDDLQIHSNLFQPPGTTVRLDASFTVYGFRSDDSAERQP